MNRQQKEKFIEGLRNRLQHDQSVFLVGYKGMSVSQITRLRRQLSEKGAEFQVAKVSLVKRVAQEFPAVVGLSPYLKEQIALVFAEQEGSVVAKILHDFVKDNAQLSIVAGAVESRILMPQAIDALSKLPTREVILAQLCGTLQAPSQQFVGLLNMLILRLLFVLKKIESKKQESN